uniref:DNA-directed RNA polymerase II subunit RPB1 n=1 Tax=viral metagenome TaxID=1070528 RepID=A0A6C0H092_9ZZZZ
MFIEYKMEYNIDEIVNINKIQFCVFGNDEVKRYSVVNKDPYGINIPETYDSHEPKRGGLIDSRLGTTDYQVNCATCGLNNDDCPGHFGHTDLAEPVFHFGFIESVKNIMGCICIRCSKLLIYKTEKEMNDILKNRIGKARFDEIKRLTSNITYCQNPDYSCGAPISSIRIHESGIQLVAETKVEEGEEGTIISNKGKQKIQEILSAEDTYNILKNVSDIDCRIMGFDPLLNRPENLIITIFPIPPVAIRPTIRRDAIASKSFEDSMTDKLADIIKRNVILRTNKEKSAMLNEEFKYNDSHHQALQYHIATYFDNETSVLQKSEQKTGGRLYKSVSERLKGKQGRVRGNLLGKRTNFSGRTVITSNPDVGTDELGVPLKLAMTLTFPEVVTPQNVGRLTKLVKNGRDNYPGANYVYPKGNTKRPIDLRYRKKNIRLYYGDIVERHLIDGDYVLYNRQPSLHKLSMMGHRIVVLKDPELTTFGMNVSVTSPYNADYDGDEMNIFVPQSIQSSIELEMIANVRNQIIAPAATNIKIATKQDAPLGVYLLTREYAKIDYRHSSDIISKIRNLDIELEKKDDFVLTNDIFSSLLPKKLNIVEYDDKGEKKLEILNGKLLKGVLNSKIVNGTILNTILDQFGNDIATDYIDNLQRLILQYLLSNGTTVGLKDVIISKDALLKCKDMLRTKKVEVECMLTEIENNPDLIDLDTLEINMTSLLQSVTGDITKVTMADLDKNNNLAILVNSGAKGKPDQVSSMSTARGQIVLNFARIKKKINNRTFPHYFQNDDRPEARGYLESSLLEGQSPLEFFMDAMTGREGLIDTAIKSVTGDTKILIRENNKEPYEVEIGPWIDDILSKSEKDKIQIYPDQGNLELLEINDKDLEIPTVNNTSCHTFWSCINAVTRHDPGEIIYYVDTLGGRHVKIAASQSLIIWDNNEFKLVPKLSSEIIEGDLVPISENYNENTLGLCDFDTITKIIPVKVSDTPYKKLYDLTISSTFNFGIANGLYVRDTADSGYINRRLIKCMEDVAVHYDGTIRNGNNVIVQYVYGDSHLDQVKQKNTKLKTLSMNNEKLKEKYYFNDTEIETLTNQFKLNKNDLNDINNEFFEELKQFRNKMRICYRKSNVEYKMVDDSYYMPVSFHRIIDNARYGIQSVANDLDPIYIMESINYILDQKNTQILCMTQEEKNSDISMKVIIDKTHKTLFKYGLYEYLAPKRCILEYKLDKTKFNVIVKDIINSFNKCLVEPGEMVGCVGSQSIGEQTTQMTLNTKHSSGAGVAGMQGIPRLNEILRKSENIKTPIMYIYLNKEKQEDKDLAYTISAYLKYTSFKDIVKKIDIIFDSNLEDNYMIDDEVNIKSAMNLYGNFNVKPENLPWLYRFEISKEGLFEKKINMLEIKTKFINFWDELIVDKSMNKNFRELIKKIINGCIMTTNDNSNKLFVHIRFDITEFDNSILLDIQNMILYYFQLKGIANINDVSEISKKVYLNFNEETGDIENKQEYIITTDGINANKLRYIKYIDNNRCYFNEINTIYRLFGIEATRKALICEINKVFSGDLKLNYHHLSILCDVMTNSGEIVSIDRHGFGRMDTDPLSKASFEKTVEMFVNSAVFGEVDHLRSVSSRLIMGRAIRCGTGFPEIIIDTEILENTEYSENELSSKIINSIDTLKINENTLINDIIERTMKEEESNNFMI